MKQHSSLCQKLTARMYITPQDGSKMKPKATAVADRSTIIFKLSFFCRGSPHIEGAE